MQFFNFPLILQHALWGLFYFEKEKILDTPACKKGILESLEYRKVKNPALRGGKLLE